MTVSLVGIIKPLESITNPVKPYIKNHQGPKRMINKRKKNKARRKRRKTKVRLKKSLKRANPNQRKKRRKWWMVKKLT
jgi:hypothetical protein